VNKLFHDFVLTLLGVSQPHWPLLRMITVGILCFALLLERGGIAPASITLILVSSMGTEEFVPGEIAANTVVIAIMCALLAPDFT
jgi:hypothetical protein